MKNNFIDFGGLFFPLLSDADDVYTLFIFLYLNYVISIDYILIRKNLPALVLLKFYRIQVYADPVSHEI